MQRLRSVQLGTPRQPGEGLRLVTVRFLPRGVRKEEYRSRNFFDIWLPFLASSKELIASLKQAKTSVATFSWRYRRELQCPKLGKLSNSSCQCLGVNLSPLAVIVKSNLASPFGADGGLTGIS